MATSWVGPFLEDMASPAAPVPRPPQPTRASRMVLLSPAWTWGRTTPARADAATTLPDWRIRSRRDRPSGVGWFMRILLSWESAWVVGWTPGGDRVGRPGETKTLPSCYLVLPEMSTG